MSAIRMLPRPIRRLARLGVHGLGYEVYRRRPGHHYVPDIYGQGAAKKIDIRTLQPFATLAETVISAGTTCLFYDRLYTIHQVLTQVFADPQAEHLAAAELGVYKGGTSYF